MHVGMRFNFQYSRQLITEVYMRNITVMFQTVSRLFPNSLKIRFQIQQTSKPCKLCYLVQAIELNDKTTSTDLMN